MRPAKPPSLASWMLERFTFGSDRDAVAGDLLEEYRAGRSAGWYWQQTIAAIRAGTGRVIRAHWLALFFAVLWSSIPQSLLGIYCIRNFNHLMGLFYRMDWPYSTILDLGTFFGLDIVSLWLGLTLSLLADSLVTRTLSTKGLLRGMWIGMLSYIPIRTAIAVLPIFPGHRIDLRHVTDVQLLLDPKLLVYKLPYLLCLLLSLWAALPRTNRGIPKRIS